MQCIGGVAQVSRFTLCFTQPGAAEFLPGLIVTTGVKQTTDLHKSSDPKLQLVLWLQLFQQLSAGCQGFGSAVADQQQ
ncbi:hypothetical protein D3C85_726600 [compost metagenome]